MTRTRERGQPRADGGVQVRTGGSDHTRGEGRNIEFMVGAQHQRRAHQFGEAGIARTPGFAQQVVDRTGRMPGHQQRRVLP